MRTVQNDPASTTLLVKDFILQGTDPIADLYHKSVSNGRLNLFNSLCELENYFDSNSCVEANEINLQIDGVRLNSINSELFIQFQLEGETYLKARLVDATGRLVKQQYLSNINTGDHQLIWSIGDISPGLYYTIFNTKLNVLSNPVLIF